MGKHGSGRADAPKGHQEPRPQGASPSVGRRGNAQGSSSPYPLKRPAGTAERFAEFARAYGWRAYAIPVLAVLTVWVLVDIFINAQPSSQPGNTGNTANTAASVSASGEASGAGAESLAGPNPADQDIPAIANNELPAGAAYTQRGEGTFRAVGTPGARAGQAEAREFTYAIEVENGIDTSAYGGDDAFATMVDATLTAAKGWTNDPRFAFRHVSADEDPDLRIQLTSVETTHELCGNNIDMETSCYYADGGRVVLNESRWVRGATPFQGDLGAYRQYLINHEVGHGIGFDAHEGCRADGELAPIMMQQTLSLNNSELHRIDPNEVYPDDDATCTHNPWPYPFA